MKRFKLNMFAAAWVVMVCWVSQAGALTIGDVTGDDAPGGDIGVVDAIDIEEGHLVIGDHLYRLVEETLYLTSTDEPVVKSFFKEGMPVRYLLEGEDVLVLWELEDPEGDYLPGGSDDDEPRRKDVEPNVSDPTELEGEVRKEGGVWTN
jgi:hypothetical protein